MQPYVIKSVIIKLKKTLSLYINFCGEFPISIIVKKWGSSKWTLAVSGYSLSATSHLYRHKLPVSSVQTSSFDLHVGYPDLWFMWDVSRSGVAELPTFLTPVPSSPSHYTLLWANCSPRIVLSQNARIRIFLIIHNTFETKLVWLSLFWRIMEKEVNMREFVITPTQNCVCTYYHLLAHSLTCF